MSDQTPPVTGRAPSKALLYLTICTGLALFAGFCYLAWDYLRSDVRAGFGWGPWVLGAVGIILIIFGFSLNAYYYHKAGEGIVIDKDIIGGGDMALSFELLVEGYNRAGQMTQDWVAVTAGTYEEKNRGDSISLR